MELVESKGLLQHKHCRFVLLFVVIVKTSDLQVLEGTFIVKSGVYLIAYLMIVEEDLEDYDPSQ